MAKKHRIVIAENHTILRDGLRLLLDSKSGMEVVGEAENGREAVRCVEKYFPDLVLMDISMPKLSGIEAIREIKKRSPETKIIALTVHKSEEYLLATLKAGSEGYVLKDATQDELILAIQCVMKGESYLSPGISGKVIDGYVKSQTEIKASSTWDTLTKREREILKMIAEGNKNKETAKYLRISLKTVEKHRSNLMKKLKLHNTAALTAYALEKRLIEK